MVDIRGYGDGVCRTVLLASSADRHFADVRSHCRRHDGQSARARSSSQASGRGGFHLFRPHDDNLHSHFFHAGHRREWRAPITGKSDHPKIRTKTGVVDSIADDLHHVSSYADRDNDNIGSDDGGFDRPDTHCTWHAAGNDRCDGGVDLDYGDVRTADKPAGDVDRTGRGYALYRLHRPTCFRGFSTGSHCCFHARLPLPEEG